MIGGNDARAATGPGPSGVKRKRRVPMSNHVHALLADLDICSVLEKIHNPDSTPEELIQNKTETGLTSEVPGASEVVSVPVTKYSGSKLNNVVDCSGSRTTVKAGAPSPEPSTEQLILTPRLSPAPQISVNRTPQTAPTRERSTRKRKRNPCCCVADQYSSARQDFMAIAKSNIEEMKMLAAAVTTHVEAAKLHSEAMKDLAVVAMQQADATKMHAESMMNFAKAAKLQAQANLKLASAIEKLCNN